MECKTCGGPLPVRTEPKGRKRIYCSTKCRMIAWMGRKKELLGGIMQSVEGTCAHTNHGLPHQFRPDCIDWRQVGAGRKTIEDRLQIIEEKLDKIFCELVAHNSRTPEYFGRQTDMLQQLMSQPPDFKKS